MALASAVGVAPAREWGCRHAQITRHPALLYIEDPYGRQSTLVQNGSAAASFEGAEGDGAGPADAEQHGEDLQSLGSSTYSLAPSVFLKMQRRSLVTTSD